MYLVQQITNDPKQQLTLVLPDGSQTTIVIQYKSMQLGWFILSLTYKTFTVQNLRIVTSPDLLYQFRNQIPFGMAVFVAGNQEPTLIDDFASGRATMYLLDRSEVVLWSEVLSGQVRP